LGGGAEKFLHSNSSKFVVFMIQGAGGGEVSGGGTHYM